MIKRLLALTVTVLLVSCAGLQDVVKKEIVTVNKPVPYCPAPPVVPTYDFLVDTLTPGDVKDPGKVAQYYKYDMEQLRRTNQLMRLILEQYRTTAGNLVGVQSEIDKIFKELDEADKKKVEPLITK